MSYLGNSPTEELILRLEARKSFSLALWLQDSNGHPLDVTGAELRMVVKREPLDPDDSTDADNLIGAGDAAIIDGPLGYARLSLQAEDLDFTPGEYPYSIVLWHEGYSTVLAKGTLDLQQNTEFLSVGEAYTPTVAATSLVLRLARRQTIIFRVGPTLAPGVSSFSDDDKARLDTLWGERAP